MADRHIVEGTVRNNFQARALPPPYKATGDASIDRLAFFHVLEQLKVSIGRDYRWIEVLLTESKTQKRTGWVDHDVSSYQNSVAFNRLKSKNPRL